MAEKKSAAAKEEKAAQAAEQTAADQAAKNAEEAKDAKSAAKEDPTAALKQQIADLKKQLDEKDDQYLRAQAEIQNMNNHFKKERAQLIKYDGQGLAKDILPVLDNLKRALATQLDDKQAQEFKKGIQMVHDDLEKALKDHGIVEIPAEPGTPFDPTKHQAVQTAPASDDQKADTIVQVLQAGYEMKDRVLRPSMVVVAQ